MIRPVLAVAFAILSSLPAVAQDQAPLVVPPTLPMPMPAPPAQASRPAPPPVAQPGVEAFSDPSCEPLLAQPPWMVKNKLFAFEVVFGKKAIDWTDEDYRALALKARDCHGVRKGKYRIEATEWYTQISAAREKLLPLVEISKAVAKFGEQLAPEEIVFPECPAVLEWKLDAYSQEDGSRRMFGKSFVAMGEGDLDRAIKYVNQCLAFLPDYAFIAKAWRPEVTVEFVNKVMDRALVVQKRRKDWATWDRKETDIVVEQEGVVIPPTMASLEAREMILRYNKASAQMRRFSPETIARLVQLSDGVLSGNRTLYDKLYGEAVRNRVQEEIFRR